MVSQTQIKKSTQKIVWDLNELYDSPQDKTLLLDLNKAFTEADRFNKTYKGKINTLSANQLEKAYQTLEMILTLVYKISQYIHLEYAIQTNDATIKSVVSQCDEKESDILNQLVFFDLEIGKMDQKKINLLLKDKYLNNYRYDILLNKKNNKHYLSEPEEKLSNLKNLTGIDAFRKLYNDHTSSFQFTFHMEGKEKKLNGSELRALRHHKNKTVRRDAMKLFFSKYEDHDTVFTHIFNNMLKHYQTEKKLRHYSTPISIRNTGNDLNDKTVSILHEITTQSNHLVQEYYTLKASIINCPDLTLADIYAPVPEFQKLYSFTDSKDMILSSIEKFDPHIADLAAQMFSQKRIHASIQSYKRGGAFCSSSVPGIKPYIMMNFLGKFSDVTTLAHELGHAIHDMLASQQTLLNYHPILPLAETASIFFEMIITDSILKNETDVRITQAILMDKLEDIFATSHRQNMFSNFEMDVHREIKDVWLSSGDLCDLYEKNLKQMFGTSVQYTPEYRWEWSTIPHFIDTPFYVYAYNFGNLLVFSLYQHYLEEGTTFVPKFKEFLGMGSFSDPKQLCKRVNADIEDPKFWKKSITFIESMLERLKQTL